MPFTFESLSAAAAALILVLALIHVAGRGMRAFGVRRAASPAGGSRIRLQGTFPLDQTRRLHIVRCDERDLLLLTGGSADIVVGWIGQPVGTPESSGS